MFFVWVFLFHILASASTVLIQIPSAWASGARWGREQEAQPIICPVGIPQGLWVWLLSPSLPLPSRVVQWIQSMCTPSYSRQGVLVSCNTGTRNGQLGGEHVTHIAGETALGQQCYSYNLKALPLPQTFFLLPCPYEEKAVLVLHLDFRHQSKCSSCTRACPIQF